MLKEFMTWIDCQRYANAMIVNLLQQKVEQDSADVFLRLEKSHIQLKVHGF